MHRPLLLGSLALADPSKVKKIVNFEGKDLAYARASSSAESSGSTSCDMFCVFASKLPKERLVHRESNAHDTVYRLMRAGTSRLLNAE